MSALAASLKKQLVLVQEENERHAAALDRTVEALNEALTVLGRHEPDFADLIRSDLGVARMTSKE